MPANQSLGVRDNTKIETAIREIDVAVGRVVLTPLAGGDTITLTGPEAKAFDPPESGFDVYAPEGARFHLTYETDPVDTEESRRRGPKAGSQPRRKRSTASRSSAAKKAARKATQTASKKSASKAGKASGSSPGSGSRASKSASSKSGGRKRSSTKSTKKRS